MGISPHAGLPGARLQYVVVDLEKFYPEGLKRMKTKWSKATGLEQYEEVEPAGYLIYCPRGHAIRLKNDKQLKQYNLDRQPRIVNMQGLLDPNSDVGKLMFAQDQESRENSMNILRGHVIKLATYKSGPNIMPEMAVVYTAKALGEEVEEAA